MIRAYLRAAKRESSSLLAPVHTILPELKIRAVVRGSRMRIITAAKRFGLYSALRACRAIFFKSNLQLRLTVETIFLCVAKKRSVIAIVTVIRVSFAPKHNSLQLRQNARIRRTGRHRRHRCGGSHHLVHIDAANATGAGRCTGGGRIVGRRSFRHRHHR